MTWKTKTVAVIPCLNEEFHIAELVRDVRVFVEQVIVVDDGSTDRTVEQARTAGAIVIPNGGSLGKGASLRRGWIDAKGRGAEWVLLMDGDGQHEPSDIPKFFDEADRSGAVLVIGNRMENVEPMPWLRRRVNEWMSRRLSQIAGCALPDSQCGFRLAHLEELQQANLQTRHFEIESEMVVAFCRARHKIAFVPIQVVYRNETSKIRVFEDTRRWFQWLRTVK